MDNVQMNHGDQKNKPKFDWYRIGTWGAVGIMAFYLLTEHTAHVIAFLPYALLLACPLMHVFMHGGHGGHQHHQDNKEKN